MWINLLANDKENYFNQLEWADATSEPSSQTLILLSEQKILIYRSIEVMPKCCTLATFHFLHNPLKKGRQICPLLKLINNKLQNQI